MAEIVVAVLILAGGAFAAIGGLGVVRLPDVLIRMHASTKIGTLSCGLIIAATGVYFGTTEIVIRAIAIILFLLLTAPIAAHMIGRAAVAIGVPLWNGSAYVAPRKPSPEDARADGGEQWEDEEGLGS
ncbi:MAG: monovalent cation/H(+) antiporter subunit G [Pseudomonadota bacterium]